MKEWEDVEVKKNCSKCDSDAEADIFVSGNDKSLDRYVIRCTNASCSNMTSLNDSIEDALLEWDKK